jgi:hypothetical protein
MLSFKILVPQQNKRLQSDKVPATREVEQVHESLKWVVIFAVDVENF